MRDSFHYFVMLCMSVYAYVSANVYVVCDVVSLQNEIQYDSSMMKIATQTKLQLGLLAFFRSESKD